MPATANSLNMPRAPVVIRRRSTACPRASMDVGERGHDLSDPRARSGTPRRHGAQQPRRAFRVDRAREGGPGCRASRPGPCMATCCAPSAAGGAARAGCAARGPGASRQGSAPAPRTEGGRFEQRPAGPPVLLALLPGLGPRVATAQQRQRLVGTVARNRRLARRIARQDQAERQQREDRQHPGRRVVQERRQAWDCWPPSALKATRGSPPTPWPAHRWHGRPAERGQYQDQRETVDQRQHAEGAEGGRRHRPAVPRRRARRRQGRARLPAAQ